MHKKITHAVVTGASGGIDSAIAIALLDCGIKVTLMGRNLEPLKATVSNSASASGGIAIVCDVSCSDSVKQAFCDAVEAQGGIQLLVNCAGAAVTQPFHKLTEEAWQQSLGVNLHGVFHCTKQVIDTMRSDQFGRIINIASTSAIKGYAYVSAYCASKHAVLGLTRSLALETAKLGVTVNAVCPGYTDTQIIRDGVDIIVNKTGRTQAAALAEFTNSNPQKRLVTPNEVASAVLWLCSEYSNAITGQAISVSGGEVM